MNKYVKKRIEVEALQIHGNVSEIKDFIGENGDAYTAGSILDRPHTVVTIHTLEGDMRATDGDYIIKGIKGEFYPCRKDIFEETYEPSNKEDNIMTKENFLQEVKVENLNEQIETGDDIGTLKERAFARGWNACQREILNNIDKVFPSIDIDNFDERIKKLEEQVKEYVPVRCTEMVKEGKEE